MSDPLAELVANVLDVLEALPCGAMLLDRAGRIVHANSRLAALAQRPRAELIGRNLRDVYTDRAARARIEEYLADFGAAREFEFHIPLPDGRHLPVLAAGDRLCRDGVCAAYRLVTVLDISALKAAQERSQEQYREIARLSDTVLEQALVLEDYSRNLEQRVGERTRELHEAYMEAITMLAVASEAKDLDTGAHVQRMRAYASALARGIGLSEREAERIGYSAILHDVGKMQVPDEILKKPGPLTPDERRIVETHTVAGEHILSEKPFFAIARQIARSHQENWDGSGYPDGLAAEQIPLAARIVRLADVFDALTSPRVYKAPWPLARAVKTIREGAGTLFDPQVVDAFLKLIDDAAWPLPEAATGRPEPAVPAAAARRE